MNSRQGFVTILALLFLIFLSGILLFQLQGYQHHGGLLALNSVL